MGPTGPYLALLGLTRPYLAFTGPYWALLGLTGALQGLTGPYWALLGLKLNFGWWVVGGGGWWWLRVILVLSFKPSLTTLDLSSLEVLLSSSISFCLSDF